MTRSSIPFTAARLRKRAQVLSVHKRCSGSAAQSPDGRRSVEEDGVGVSVGDLRHVFEDVLLGDDSQQPPGKQNRTDGRGESGTKGGFVVKSQRTQKRTFVRGFALQFKNKASVFPFQTFGNLLF